MTCEKLPHLLVSRWGFLLPRAVRRGRDAGCAEELQGSEACAEAENVSPVWTGDTR